MRRKVYVDHKSNEIENLLSGKKKHIIKGANIKKYPYKMINEGDTLYLLNNDSEGIVLASCIVKKVIFYEAKSQEDSVNFVDTYKDKILMTKQRMNYICKRKYISLFEVTNIKGEYATINNSLWTKEEDWVRIEPIDK